MRNIFKFILTIVILLTNIYFSQEHTQNRIADVINLVNKDSLTSYIKSLQNFGTRYALAENNYEVCKWIENKFKEVSNAVITVDSFKVTLEIDGDSITTWQRNVIATFPGTSGEIKNMYLLIAHHDATNLDLDANQNIFAPGADDNASGVASLIEAARVISKSGYKPLCNIKLVALSMEEIGHFAGSKNMCNHLIDSSYKVKLVINNDMIAFSTKDLSNSSLRINYYSNFELYKDISKILADKYSIITSKDGANNLLADSEIFALQGFPTIFFFEDEFNPNYHSSEDIIENLNMDYCAEVVKASLGTLLDFVENDSKPMPPINIVAEPMLNSIGLFWSELAGQDIIGYNVYRSESEDGEYALLNSGLIQEKQYKDTRVKSNTYYYYYVKSVNSKLNESVYNFPVKSKAVTLDQGILVVDETYNGDGSILNPTNEQVDLFFDSLLVGYNYNVLEVENLDKVTLDELGSYSTIIWHGDDQRSFTVPQKSTDELKKYLQFGGNFIYAGFYPSKAFQKNSTYPKTFTKNDFMYDVLKINKVDFQAVSRFWGASGYSDYPDILVDTTKTKESLGYHMIGIESIETDTNAKVIYRYVSKYDSLTPQGSMQYYPVGVEYFGNDYRTITLSFPLYYMDMSEAKSLINTMLSKLNEVMDIENENGKVRIKEFTVFNNYPNPFNPTTTIKFNIPVETLRATSLQKVTLTVYDILGREIKTLVDETKIAGEYSVTWDGKDISGNEVSSGIYFYNIRFGDKSISKKMLMIK